MSSRRAGVYLLLVALISGCSSSSNPTESNVTCGAEGLCPVPLHATAACVGDHCGRTACEEGWFDFDGAETFGCEASCQGAICKLGDGSVQTFSAPPVPEAGLVASVLASNAPDAAGGAAVLGESTPPAENGLTSSASSGTMVIGFMATQQ